MFSLLARLVAFLAIALAPMSALSQEAAMFGGVARSVEEQAADKAYVEEALKLGTADAVAAELVTEGWFALDEGDLDTAMFRFNRAWLVQPDRGDVHWGFAIVSHLRGAPVEEVEKHFATAQPAKTNDADFQAMHGRVLFDHERYRESTLYFLRALEIDPKNKTAHLGMWYAADALGDAATSEKHRRLYEE